MYSNHVSHRLKPAKQPLVARQPNSLVDFCGELDQSSIDTAVLKLNGAIIYSGIALKSYVFNLGHILNFYVSPISISTLFEIKYN